MEIDRRVKRKSTAPNLDCENIYILPLSRVRAHAQYRSFCLFAVTSVTGIYAMRYVSIHCGVFCTYFKIFGFQRLKIHREHDQKSFLSLFRPPEIGQFFHQNFPFAWHLWQQKMNIAVGRRARTRVRESRNTKRLILSSTLCKTRVQKNSLSLFPWLFTLWSYIDPYTYRGWLVIRCHMWHGRNRENADKRSSGSVVKDREG